MATAVIAVIGAALRKQRNNRLVISLNVIGRAVFLAIAIFGNQQLKNVPKSKMYIWVVCLFMAELKWVES